MLRISPFAVIECRYNYWQAKSLDLMKDALMAIMSRLCLKRFLRYAMKHYLWFKQMEYITRLSEQINIYCSIGKMCGVYLHSEYWREYFSSNEFTLSCEDDVHRKRSLWRILCVTSLAKLQSLRPKFRCVKRVLKFFGWKTDH